MKKVNLWKTLFFSVLAAAAFTGCSDDDSDDGGGIPSITVNGGKTATVAVALEGGETEAVTIESSGDWTVTFSGDDVANCEALPATGGRGTTSLKFELGSRAAERTITATVTTSGSFEGIPLQDKVTITIMQNSDGSTEAKTNVAEIRALLKAMNPGQDKVAVTDEIAAKTITGIVVSKFEGHNFGNDYNIAVQDASGAKDSGLTLNANQFSDLKLSAGAVVTVPLTAAQVNTYGGVIQLAIDKSVTIETSTTEAPEPIVVTVDQLSDYESMLVKIENCMPATGTAGKAWNNSTNKGNADFVTSDGKSFVVRTGSKAAFKDELIPDKFGYLIGIAGQYNGDLQLSPRTADDLAGLNQDAPAPEYQEVTIDKLGEGNYKIKDATIVGVHQKGVMFAQEVSGTVYYVLGFNNEWTTQTSNPYIESVGKLAEVQGICQDRFGLYQFSTFEVTTGNDSSLQLPTPETFDAAAIDAYTKAPAYKYVKLSGVLNIEKGSSYNTYTITVAGVSDKTITLAYGLDAMFTGVADGDVVDATAIALGYDSKNAKLNIMLTSISKNTSTPAVTITTTPSTFAAEGDTQDIAFTVANAGSNKVYAKVEGEGFSVPTGAVTSPVKVTAEANTGAAREATLTIYVAASEGGEAVAQATVTLKQAAPLPSGVATVTLTIDNIVSGKNGSIELGTSNYGSQDVNVESSWYTWSTSSINFSGVRITQGKGAEGAYNNSVLQMQGNKDGAAKQGFILNTTSLGEIVSIKVICQNSKESNTPGYHMYFGTEKNPSGNEMSCSSTVDGAGALWSFTDTFDVSGKGYSYFKLYNNNNYTLYVKSIEITYKN